MLNDKDESSLKYVKEQLLHTVLKFSTNWIYFGFTWNGFALFLFWWALCLLTNATHIQ